MRAILLHRPLVVLAGFYTRKRVTTTQCDLREQGGSGQRPGGRGPDSPAQRGRPSQPRPEPSANGDAAADPATADGAAARTAASTWRAPAEQRAAAAAARVPPVVARSSTSRTRPPARRWRGAGGGRGGGLARAGPAGAAEVAAARRGEQVDQGQAQGGGDAAGDPPGVVPGRAGDPAGGDVGDQVGPGPGDGQGGAEATAELVQGGRLAVELAGQHRRAEGVAVRAEGPQPHLRVGGQQPWPDRPRLRRQAAGAARPRHRHPTGQAPGRSQQPHQGIDEEHARRLAASPGRRSGLSTAPGQRLAKLGSASKALGVGKVR